MLYKKGAGEPFCQQPDRMIGEGMPLQIIDKKTGARIGLHPFEHIDQLVVRKMMTEKRRENDIGSFIAEGDVTIIRKDYGSIRARESFPCDGHTMRITIDADEFYSDLSAAAIPGKGQQVIAAAAADLRDADPSFVFQ